jgi:glucose-6-phosphate isomerase
MGVKYYFENMLSENIGDKGIDFEDIEKFSEKAFEYHEKLVNKRKNGELGFFELPYDEELVKKIKIEVEKRKNTKNFVVIGIGGSSLGNITLHEAINGKFHNEKKNKNVPNMYFADNVDPEKLYDLIEVLSPADTVFNVITKSGSTAETMANFMVLYDFMKKNAPDKIKDNIIVTTDKEKGNLRKIADDLGLTSFVIPGNVGGRFSVLSSVGLLSAAFEGIDIEKLLQGAADMDKRCSNPEFLENPAYVSAYLYYKFFVDKGVNINVLMPYCEYLYSFADWFRQLWAESLGKKKGSSFVGMTPVKALGTIDQHSQVQLYVEGPFDKTVTFIEVENFRKKVEIPKVFENIEGLNYLSGHTLNELINYEKKATELALTEAKRPNATILIDEVNEYNLGAMFYMFEVMTAFAGELFEINAFDQPGVEAGKIATYALMGRKGYEEKKKEIENILNNKKRREI